MTENGTVVYRSDMVADITPGHEASLAVSNETALTNLTNLHVSLVENLSNQTTLFAT